MVVPFGMIGRRLSFDNLTLMDWDIVVSGAGREGDGIATSLSVDIGGTALGPEEGGNGTMAVGSEAVGVEVLWSLGETASGIKGCANVSVRFDGGIALGIFGP